MNSARRERGIRTGAQGCAVAWAVVLLSLTCGGRADEPTPERPAADRGAGVVEAADRADSPSALAGAPMGGPWFSEYGAARDAAKSEHRMLLILFCDASRQALFDRFQQLMVQDPDIALHLRHFIKAKIPLDATTGAADGQTITVLQHAAFREMLGRPGLAILDFRDEKSRQYHQVVSVYPFPAVAAMEILGDGPLVTRAELNELLTLPAGTLTQRTLVFAVRTHPEQPLSAAGEWSDVLVAEAEQHAGYQAELQLQGHHDWESRFHRINARLPSHAIAQEVCAESWAGQGLLEAARECVRSWRQSDGHWGAVRERQRFFGFDMHRGHNGVWYATGIFGRDR